MIRRLLCIVALSGAAVLGAASAHAQDPACDSYSGNCVDTGGKKVGTKVKGTKTTQGSLPFTGGEATLLLATGAGAVAAGTVLVGSARRRARSAG